LYRETLSCLTGAVALQKYEAYLNYKQRLKKMAAQSLSVYRRVDEAA
jgi:hypothetical protein